MTPMPPPTPGRAPTLPMTRVADRRWLLLNGGCRPERSDAASNRSVRRRHVAVADRHACHRRRTRTVDPHRGSRASAALPSMNRRASARPIDHVRRSGDLRPASERTHRRARSIESVGAGICLQHGLAQRSRSRHHTTDLECPLSCSTTYSRRPRPLEPATGRARAATTAAAPRLPARAFIAGSIIDAAVACRVNRPGRANGSDRADEQRDDAEARARGRTGRRVRRCAASAASACFTRVR